MLLRKDVECMEKGSGKQVDYIRKWWNYIPLHDMAI